MKFYGTGAPLLESDIMELAFKLRCDIPSLKAVIEVESSGKGFLSDNRPKILFESRWFGRLTGNKYDRAYPNISTSRWIRNYRGGKAEYVRLERAMNLNEKAALKSTSWGLFQVLGVNYSLCGYETIYDFIKDQIESEFTQMKAFLGFIMAKKLDDEIREHRWADFARVYNGPGYYKNSYDIKLEKAYRKYADA